MPNSSKIDSLNSPSSEGFNTSHSYRKIHINEIYYPMTILSPKIMEHAEGKTHFHKIQNENDLELLYSLDIEYVWILKDTVIPKKPKQTVARIESKKQQILQEEHQHIEPKTKVYESLTKELARSKYFFDQSYIQIRSSLDSIRQTGILDLEDMTSIVEDIATSVARNPTTLLCMRGLQNADEYTYFHSINVALLAGIFAQFLGYGPQEIRDISLAGILHDIGKQRIPLGILNASRKLTDKEFKIMKLHTKLAHKILNNEKNLPKGVREGVFGHHEKFDGTGYPHGLKGDEIHPYAAILSLADIYDALTSERVYKHAFSQSKTAAIIYGQKGISFSPEMVTQFISCFGVYPIGSLVRLSNDTFGIVYENNSEALLYPKILQLSGHLGNFLSNKVQLVDLQECKESIHILSCEDIDPHKIDLKKLLLALS